MECPICFASNVDLIINPCEHQFCKACINRWCHDYGHSTCPLCRREIAQKDCQAVLWIWNEAQKMPANVYAQRLVKDKGGYVRIAVIGETIVQGCELRARQVHYRF